MIYQEICQIQEHQEIVPGYYIIEIASDKISKECKPGQFANIRISETNDPLLRRPISFFSYTDKTIQFIYRVVGYGTDLLSLKQIGDFLDIIGPLGNGFELDDLKKDKTIYVVGGGIGAVPLYPVIKYLEREGYKYEVLTGARTAEELVLLDIYDDRNIPHCVITDDGSVNCKGFVTDLLKERLDKNKNAEILCCGPHLMMKAVAQLCADYDVACQVSLEEKMACGIGACVGCVVDTTDGWNKKVCKDGPVFGSDQIVW
jgi:dihydroorotate dehydrogenase electron transfer subunit